MTSDAFSWQVTEYPIKNGLKNKNVIACINFKVESSGIGHYFCDEFLRDSLAFPSDTKMVPTIPSITSLVTMFKSEKENSCYSFFPFFNQK